MARLEDEFRNILISHATPIETESLTESISSAGDSSKQCLVYRVLRRHRLQHESVRKSAVECQLQEARRREVKHRRHQTAGMGGFECEDWEVDTCWQKCALGFSFASEKRRLCEQIFQGLGSAADEAFFMETVKGPAVQLFNFAEAISISRRAPEKLFKILDLHDTLLDLLPDIDAVFEDYKETLGELIVSRPATGSRYSDDVNTPDMDFTDEHEEQSALALHLIWIIVILQFNLEGKSKHYKDTSLSHVFIMNNVHYIVQKIKSSLELRDMIGDTYLKKLTGKFRQAATSYQRATWVGSDDGKWMETRKEEASS
ncbi:hypothetical protein E3N88_21491 [Mikania micrantha]|uniref:Exocyst subunit Exo70 family protein n=1 Tax=Mikania micrantha TaxID=192012 RepID=A0A5N6NMS7_9ASTR|nr:hypothetical protein E3N88_21491 [Mikania micrantha]